VSGQVETKTVAIAGQFTWRKLRRMGRYRWLGWAVPVVFVAFLSMREIGSADFWWQWAAGRYILENGIPWLDPWLTTSEPRPWIEMRWLYCIGLYGAVEYAGAWLAIFCAAVLYCSGLGFVLKSGAGSARWTLAIGVLAAIAIGRRLSVRPEAFTFAFLGVLLFLISRVRQGRLEPKWALIWMGLTQILWANTHALFAIGPVFCALWAFVELLQKGNYPQEFKRSANVIGDCAELQFGAPQVGIPKELDFAEPHEVVVASGEIG
jgi:hypothetical protein